MKYKAPEHVKIEDGFRISAATTTTTKTTIIIANEQNTVRVCVFIHSAGSFCSFFEDKKTNENQSV